MGASGKILQSTDNGSSWTSNSFDSLTTNVFGIAHGEKTTVFVGASGNIFTIDDSGESDVTTRTSGTTEHLRRVFYKE